jgi:transcriptional regulator with XRE-family HTH domain
MGFEPSEIARRLQEALDDDPASAASIARDVGIEASALYQILSGKTKSPRFENAMALAKRLRLNPWYLYEGKSPRRLREPAWPFEDITPEQWARIPDVLKNAVLAALRDYLAHEGAHRSAPR